MDRVNYFSIPLKGMQNGFHHFQFEVDDLFFKGYENSPVSSGRFEVFVSADKRPDLILLDFSISGKMASNCDRCLAGINIPVEGSFELVLKYAEDYHEQDEVLFIPQSTEDIDLDKYIYEFICLSLPLVKIYDCENDEPAPCDLRVLKILENQGENTSFGEKDTVWSILNQIGQDSSNK